jgi:O-antigen/teichoic acid export membrane protein
MQASAFLGVRPLQQVWTAEMYDVYKKPDAASVFGGFMLRLMCVQAFAALFISLFALESVQIMCDSSYHNAAILIPLFGLNSIIVLFGTQMNNTFFITRKTNYNLFCTMYSLPFIFLFMCLFVPGGGIVGAAIAQCLASIVYVGFIYYFTQRFFYVRYSFGKMAMLLTITVSCYSLSLLCGGGIGEFTAHSKWDKIMNIWYHLQWFSILAKMGIVCFWGVLIWFSGILSLEDKAVAIRVLIRGLKKLHLFRNKS